MPSRKTIASALLFVLGVVSAANAGENGAEVTRVAFFGFRLVNTSLEPVSANEDRRIRLLDEMLQQKLDASGRFRIIGMPAAVRDELAGGFSVDNCNGCKREVAQKIGADWAAWGVVQKVSNLILNINLYMENARDGRMTFARSVDIRGNTDESWRRGLDYMLRQHLLDEP